MPACLNKCQLIGLKAKGGGSRLLDVQIREMENNLGDPSLEATLVFANSVTDDDLRWRKIEPVVQEARRIVRETMADGKYVYFKVRRRKELATA